MKKMYVKSLKEYEEETLFDEKRLLEAMKKAKKRRRPTSVALEERTIVELKRLADKKNVPYQVLMRMFIVDGLEKMKKVA